MPKTTHTGCQLCKQGWAAHERCCGACPGTHDTTCPNNPLARK